MVKAAETLQGQLAGVLRWFKSGLANGLLEGINSLLKAAKSKARGYRTIRNLITMAYLTAGKLDFNLAPAWQTARLKPAPAHSIQWGTDLEGMEGPNNLFNSNGDPFILSEKSTLRRILINITINMYIYILIGSKFAFQSLPIPFPGFDPESCSKATATDRLFLKAINSASLNEGGHGFVSIFQFNFSFITYHRKGGAREQTR
jgi:hypothetical protein